MKRCALFLIAASGLLSAKTYIGIINDNKPVAANTATQCPVIRPKYTLQTADRAWVLSDQKSAARFVGKKVVIEATPGPKNELKVASITPAR
jgi:hypothetical protein